MPMHDVELCNAVLLCDEPAVEAILGRDRASALTTDENGRTLLMTAVTLGPQANGVSPAILGRLLDAGVAINAVDGDGCTVLALAMGECTGDVLRFLLARGADPNLGNPLVHGVWNDGTSADDLSLLLSAGADPRTQEIDGMNALEWAEDGGDEDIIRVLKRAARGGRKPAS
jgi:ankyrin repeat protein